MLPMLPIGPRPATAAQGVPPGAGPSLERGAYLAERVALCTGCHSKFDMRSMESTGPKAGGGEPEPSHGDDTEMEFVTPNLTSDPTGYTGRVNEDDFLARLRSGRAVPSSIMPWESFSTMTDDDVRSIYRYLRSLPPVQRDVGKTYRKIGGS